MISTKFFETGALCRFSHSSNTEQLNFECSWEPMHSTIGSFSIEIGGPSLLDVINHLQSLFDYDYHYQILSRSQSPQGKYLPDGLNLDPIICLPSSTDDVYCIELAMARSKVPFEDCNDISWLHALFGSNIETREEFINLIQTYEILES